MLVYICAIRLGVCLKLVSLEVPSHKLVGEEASLECRCSVNTGYRPQHCDIVSRFDMEGDTLYSVKWYRNEQEFYRYVPNDR